MKPNATHHIDLHLQVPTNLTMHDLRAMLERMAAAANADLNVGKSWPFHAEIIARPKQQEAA